MARSVPLARGRASRRALPGLQPQSRPPPSTTRGQAMALVVPWRGSLSRAPSLPAAPPCCAPLGGHACGGRGAAAGCCGRERGRKTGVLLGVKKGGNGRGVEQPGREGELSSLLLVGQPDPTLQQGETPPPQRRRDPLDLPTPADLSLVLCRLRDEVSAVCSAQAALWTTGGVVKFPPLLPCSCPPFLTATTAATCTVRTWSSRAAYPLCSCSSSEPLPSCSHTSANGSLPP